MTSDQFPISPYVKTSEPYPAGGAQETSGSLPKPQNVHSRVMLSIEQARKQLLELSMRNRLLNFRPARVSGIEVVDEVSEQVYQVLVIDQKAMTFKGLPVPAGTKPQIAYRWTSSTSAPNEQDEELADDGLPKLIRLPVDTTDSQLNTFLTEDKLQIRQLKISSDARTSLEEQGINTLFLALGMLVWLEAECSTTLRKAPLILVPVTLERSGAEKFRLRYSGEEIAANTSLQAKLKTDFGLELPDIENPEEVLPSAYFDAVQKAVESKPSWRMERDTIYLGFFSHAKYLMYKDLDASNWTGALSPSEHPVMSRLLGEGFEPAASPIGDEDQLDELRPVSVSHEVVDADSSQLTAITDALAGISMVIEGPPGTGKSQTICNLIAEAIANSKRVLFVSEKMAALEVVKRYLDRVGLGDACLEIHSHKAKKKAVVEELRRVLELGRPQIKDIKLLDRLSACRSQLNDYVAQLHEAVQPYGITPRQAIAQIAILQDGKSDLQDTSFSQMSKLSTKQFEELRDQVCALEHFIMKRGMPSKNPFIGANPRTLMHSDLAAQEKEWLSALELTREIMIGVDSLSSKLITTTHKKINDVLTLLDTADFLIGAPNGLHLVNLSSRHWISSQQIISTVLDTGRKYAAIHTEFDQVLVPDAWNEDVGGIRLELDSHGGSIMRFLMPGYRSAIRKMKALFIGKMPRKLEARLEVIKAVEKATDLEEQISVFSPECIAAFASMWQGTRTNWDAANAINKWYMEMAQRNRSGSLSDQLRKQFCDSNYRPVIKEEVRSLKIAIERHRGSWNAILSSLSPDEHSEWSAPDTVSLERQKELLESWINQPESLLDLQVLNGHIEKLRNQGLLCLADLASSWEGSGSHLADSFSSTYYRGILKSALADRSALREFATDLHERTIEQFRVLDQELLNLNRSRVALAHWKGLPSSGGVGQMGVLTAEMNKKRRLIPIRRLMESCFEPIQRIKPVFMMSPLSVAMFLPSHGPGFDLLIFDEASQVRPEDALGAIMRARQAVVVGDSQQMPPTSFFERLVTDKDEETAEDDPAVVRTDEMESILRLFRGKGAHYRHLKWHYRSRHHSLIAVSNNEFYDDKLAIFPHPQPRATNLGLTLRHLPGTSYARGTSRTNLDEARAVVEEVLRHSRETPDLTLGVAALSMAQQEAISRQLEKERDRSPDLQEFERMHPEEPFFIKNLENIQGDERDVIIISIGYGRTSEGYMSHNFGPINSEGGERRLNVLISRARRRCIVFSNFKSGDIDLTRTGSSGVRILKNFLEYADTGNLAGSPMPDSREPESDFEESVKRDLTEAGFKVHCQVGTSGFFIDLAVVHPEEPGRYILGIECDGPKYHSARSARDRDRLRQAVLENKGWTIHRIWGKDWIEHKEREHSKLIELLEQLLTEPREEKAISSLSVGSDYRSHEIIRDDTALKQTISMDHSVKPRLTTPATQPTSRSEPRARNIHSASWERSSKLHNDSMYQYTDLGSELAKAHLELSKLFARTSLLSGCILKIIRTESPVHLDEIVRRLRENCDGGRLGQNMRTKFEWVFNLLQDRKLAVRRGDFFWVPDMVEPPVRSRSGFPTTAKKIEYIAPEEIAAAITLTIEQTCGATKEDVAFEALRLLGFSRTATLLPPLLDAVDHLVRTGRIEERSGFIERATGA